ncbi:MAG: biotin--[acetyl-CoA-carboxylase] ligase [Lachnospiraceae bacterium]
MREVGVRGFITVKKKILKMLEESNGYVSGQELSDTLGVSRTAVWKVIKKLKEEGYEIEAVSNKGYCLKRVPDLITEEACESVIGTVWAGRPYVYYREIDSTNEEAKRLAKREDAHGLLVSADIQTGGKGRMGRSWKSPLGTNIAMSLILKPNILTQRVSMLTLVAALSVSQAIDEVTGLKSQIKWPNDIVVNGKKVCGILTEMSADMDQIYYVIVGIGINVNLEEFPEEIVKTATSLKLETGRLISRSEVIAVCLKYMEKNYSKFLEHQSMKLLLEEYQERLVNVGNQVRVLAPGKEYTGISQGIDEWGELLVEDEMGELHHVISGEVSVRGIYGYV